MTQVAWVQAGENHKGILKLWRKLTSKLYAGLTGMLPPYLL